MSKLIPIPEEVWCLACGCIHDESTDPYRYGYAETGEPPACQPTDWRRLYWRTRKEDGEFMEDDNG